MSLYRVWTEEPDPVEFSDFEGALAFGRATFLGGFQDVFIDAPAHDREWSGLTEREYYTAEAMFRDLR